MGAKYNDPAYIGKKYNMLTVIGFDKKIYNSRQQAWRWRVRCDCGNETIVSPSKLFSGATKSCGCMKVDRCKTYTEKYRTIHGGRHERLYAIWHGMKERCYTRTNKDYKNYGERGIAICDEWKNDYAAFREWAKLNGYKDGLTIERKDYNADYCPENCTWITLAEQTRNKRNNVKVQYGGKTWVLSELCAEKGLKYITIYGRIFHSGWPIERAIEEPIQPRKKKLLCQAK